MTPDLEAMKFGVPVRRHAFAFRTTGENCCGVGVNRIRAGTDGLRPLASVPIDRQSLETQLPGFHVGLGDVLDRGGLRQVDRLGNRPRQERLHGPHHGEVPSIGQGPGSVDRLEGAVEDGKVLRLQLRSPFDGLLLFDPLKNLLGVVVRISQSLKGLADGVVHQLQAPAADQGLVLHQSDVRFDARRIAIHHESDGAGWSQDRDLGVSESVLLPELAGSIPTLPPLFDQFGRSSSEFVCGLSVPGDDCQH